MSLAVHQHFVPRFLLKRFAHGAQHHVHVFDKHTGRSWPSPVDDVATTRHYYNVPHEVTAQFVAFLRQQGQDDLATAAGSMTMTLEPALGRVEGVAAEIIERIVRTECVSDMSDRDRVMLALFVIVQFLRTPLERHQIAQSGAAMQQLIADAVVREGHDASMLLDPSGPHAMTAARAAHQHLSLIEQAPEMVPHLLDKDLMLFKTDRDHPLYIGDAPVSLVNHGPRGRSPHRGFGLRTPQTEVCLPLTPTLALVYLCPTIGDSAAALLDARATQRHVGSDVDEADRPLRELLDHIETGHPMLLAPANVEHLNSRQISGAARFVYANDGAFTLAREMIATDPTLREPPSIVVR